MPGPLGRAERKAPFHYYGNKKVLPPSADLFIKEGNENENRKFNAHLFFIAFMLVWTANFSSAEYVAMQGVE